MFEKTFCSSPWFHVRLTYDGGFIPCRWAKTFEKTHNFHNETIMQYYNSEQMKSLRQSLLSGDSPELCKGCYYEESFGKLNGRKRQLAKSAVDTNNFALTLRSSPHYNNFLYSYNNQGLADRAPVDLQIDLGNVCNNACIMCFPESSSKLEKDYHTLHQISPRLFKKPPAFTPWTRDPELVNRFVQELIAIPDIRYIHFIGGETLYEESFYTICEELIRNDLAKNIIVGTTTNGTIYNERVANLIQHFKEFHLGISIESVSELNDYIRYPSQVDQVKSNIEKFLDLRKEHTGLYISLRITPTVFSIWEIDRVFEYMIDNNVIAESCYILHQPPCLRVELIPDDIREKIKLKLEKLIQKHNLNSADIINIRRSDHIDQVIANVILDYYRFICDYVKPNNIEESRRDLINFIRSFESLRNNNILYYLPEYEEFLRSYGY